MLVSRLVGRRPLTLPLRYSALIYLRDHNRLITPQSSLLKLSHLHPRNLVPGVPSQPRIEFKLAPEREEELERQIFEEYKKKILTGTIDEVEEKEVDEIWGEEAPPVHYYQRPGKADLMAVAHPQRLALQATTEAIYLPAFATSYSGPLTREHIAQASEGELVQIALRARHEGVGDGEVWWAIEEGFQRGRVFHKLTPQQLIGVKWAFSGRRKLGTPQFHAILADLLREDLPRLNPQQLVSLFYACWHCSSRGSNLQREVLRALAPHFPGFDFEQKVNFLLLFTLASRGLRHDRPVHKRRPNEYKDLARSLLFRLDLDQPALTDELAARLIYSLAKLRLANTKFITLPLLEHISVHWQSFVGDPARCLLACVHLPEVEDCEGVAGQELMGRLREAAEQHWEHYSPVERMRMVHSWWNLGLMDQALMEAYQGIELTADSTLLHYACQVELGASSGREWQIVRLMAELETVPLPYFTSYKRFYNYLASSTEWNLTPLKDKLGNTEYFHDCLRQADSLSNNPVFPRWLQFEKFVGSKLAMTQCPVGNLELTHFAEPKLQVSLDIVGEREFVPGTRQLKESYMNKVRSLQNLGWKHLAFDHRDVESGEVRDVVKSVQEAHRGHEEQQQAVLDYADYQQRRHIDHVKTEEFLHELDTKYINFLLFPEQVQDDLDPDDEFYQVPPEEDEEQPQAS